MLTGLELMFMGVTPSNSVLFSIPGFIVSPVGKREGGKKRREGGEKGMEKERKEGRRNKKVKERKKEVGIKKKEGQKGRRNSGGKEERKKKKSSAGFKLVRLVLLVFLSVEREGGFWKDWFHFSPFLSPTLHCCSASSPVPQGPSAPH